ncbi:MAG: zinc ribbon domain-containing protein [Acidobacteria bacterium]|nr:zinc ribbon domain-containing protein [Acidobacteriota bacterium]
MFCDQCGNLLATGQQYCSRCGKQVIGRLQVVSRNRVQEHVRILAILWLAYSVLNVLGGVAMIVVANTIFGRLIHVADVPGEITVWLRPLLVSIGSLILIKSAAGFLAGWGLLQRESWARILALVVGFISLLNLPVGTALGTYTLWVLLPARSDEEYRMLARKQAA